MTMLQRPHETECVTRPILWRAVGKLPQAPTPLVRITTCGLLTLEILDEIVGTDPPQARYRVLTPNLLHGRGIIPALTLLKLLTSRPERFAPNEWLREQFCQAQGEAFSSKRLDSLATFLRDLLCPSGYEALRTDLVANTRAMSNSGYRLATYPLIWVDHEALAWNVEQAIRMERFGDNSLPFWQRAYELAKRGEYLPDERYGEWAGVKREQIAGMLRQSVQALARLYADQGDKASEEEALLLLRSYWQEHPHDEDVLRPLMELLGRRDCYQEALAYYEKLCRLLEEEGEQPGEQTQDVAAYVRTKQIQRTSTFISPPRSSRENQGTNHTSSMMKSGSEQVSFANQESNLEVMLPLVSEALQHGIIEAIGSLGSQPTADHVLLGQGRSMVNFDSTKRATLRQIVTLLGGVVTGHPILNRLYWQQPPLALSQDIDLDLVERYIDALSMLLTKGEAYYVMQVSQQLYERFVQVNITAEDTHFAALHLKLGFLVAAAQEYALAWYQRHDAVVQTYNQMEHDILRKFDGTRHFRHAFARLLAKRGRQYRVLWNFEVCEEECENGLTLTREFDDYTLRTHFLCERAHIEATRGDEFAWVKKLEEARKGALDMLPDEREKALNQIEYMQGEGYKRFAFHAQKDSSLPQRIAYARSAIERLTKWNGATIEFPDFESFVMNISRAQCFILVDPRYAMTLAEQQKVQAEQRYPTLLAKIYRILFLAQLRLQMNDREFSQVFQDTSYTAYHAGANIL